MWATSPILSFGVAQELRLFAEVGCPFGLDLDGAGFACGVVVEAAPAIVFWFGDESSGDWIAVDVLDFLFELACGEDVEVVVAGLPEVGALALEEFGGLAFDDSEGGGEGVVFGFAEEKMDVLGHQDEEVVGVAGSFDDSFEDFFGVAVSR